MESGRVRELRHDFRKEYGVRYEDVETDEAIDLIYTLPPKSLYVCTVDPRLRWDETGYMLAQLIDLSWLIAWKLSGNQDEWEPPKLDRPGDEEARKAALEAAKAVKRRMEQTEWSDADG